MTLEQEPGPSYFGDFPLHIQLTIQSAAGGGYTGMLDAGTGKCHRFALQLTPHDVKAFNTQLQQAIEQVASNLTETGVGNKLVAQLAETGNYVFKRIFPEGPARNLICMSYQRY